MSKKYLEVVRYTGKAPHLYCRELKRRVNISELVELVQSGKRLVLIKDDKGQEVTSKYLLPRLPKMGVADVNAVLRFAKIVNVGS